MEIPITNHPELPEEVPLVADFNDDRNRLSYYYPILKEIDGVLTPETKFFPIEGSLETTLDIEYRHITEFMQDLGTQQAFVRGDFCSGKYEEEKGSKIESQDPYDIEQVVLEMIRQIFLSKRYTGGRIAVREWIPIEAEVRYFIRDGDILYDESLDEFTSHKPRKQIHKVAKEFDRFSWSVDFVLHEEERLWYCIDMGLDGLYHTGEEWIDISEHLDGRYSSEQYVEKMPHPNRFRYVK